MKAFKAFIKPLEAQQRRLNIRFNLFFSLRPGLGRVWLRRGQVVFRNFCITFWNNLVGTVPKYVMFFIQCVKLFRIYINSKHFMCY